MPIGPVGGAAVALGANLVSQGANAYSQGRLNRKTRKWNEKMHDILRQESLSDWNMQNEYNSPQAQMQRYRDAGLNPALIYGQSNEGATVRSSDVPSWNPRAPEYNFDARPAMQAYFDVQLKEANLDNLRAQNTVLIQEAALKAASTANTVQSTAKSQFDLALASDLRNMSLQTAEAHLRKMTAETEVMLSQNERAIVTQEYNIQEAVTRIITGRLNALKTSAEIPNIKQQREQMQAAIEGIKKDNEIKQLDIELKRKGVQPGDNILFRVVARILETYGIESFEAIKRAVPKFNLPKIPKPSIRFPTAD